MKRLEFETSEMCFISVEQNNGLVDPKTFFTLEDFEKQFFLIKYYPMQSQCRYSMQNIYTGKQAARLTELRKLYLDNDLKVI